MVSPCSICLSPFKEPVCLPCGHLYCKKCLTEHVNIPSNKGMTSTCPDCRSTFNIAIPDLTYLPEKYHPFISHAVRRLYIDLESDAALQKKLKHAEARLASKAKSEEMLLRRCESLLASVSAHRTGEAEAHDKVEELEDKIEDLEDELQELNTRYRTQEKEKLELLEEQKKQDEKIVELEKSLKAATLEAQKAKHSLRKSPRRLRIPVELEESDDSESPASSVISGSRPISDAAILNKGRYIKPLPRRRVIRARDDDSVSMILAPPKRARMFST